MRWLTRLVSRAVSAQVRELSMLKSVAEQDRTRYFRNYLKATETAKRRNVMLSAAIRDAGDAAQRTDRYRLSWLSACRRAERFKAETVTLKRQVAAGQRSMAEAMNSWADTNKSLKAQLREARREAQAAAVPPLSGADLHNLHRLNANRLADENAELRERLEKYEGVTS